MNNQESILGPWLRSGGWITLCISGLALFGALGMGYVGAHLKSSKPTLVFVRTSEVMARYKGSIQARESFQRETAGLSNEAKEVEGKLQHLLEKSNLSDAKVRDQANQLRSQLEAVRERGAKRDQELMQPVLAEVNAGIKKFAKKNGYSIVLGTLQGGVILHGDEAIDATEPLIADLNR